MPGLLVCSASHEESALADLADVVVDGPGGVLELLRTLAADIRAARA
jgi:trehalose 6-phosphate phosphatase